MFCPGKSGSAACHVQAVSQGRLLPAELKTLKMSVANDTRHSFTLKAITLLEYSTLSGKISSVSSIPRCHIRNSVQSSLFFILKLTLSLVSFFIKRLLSSCVQVCTKIKPFIRLILFNLFRGLNSPTV